MNNYNLIKSFVDAECANPDYDVGSSCERFIEKLKKLNNKDFINLLLFTGFIPDLYVHYLREELLYTKFAEIVAANWARRLDLDVNIIKQKSGFEDFNFTLNGKIVVCDVKTFRLGRSQLAPNIKGFLNLQAIKNWLDRHKRKLGGLLIFPDTHDWDKGSDAYQYCTIKNIPTLMLSYKHLAYLLYHKDKYNIKALEKLWDYKRLFPQPLLKAECNNKELYWDIINKEIVEITNSTNKQFLSFIKKCDQKEKEYINFVLDQLRSIQETITSKVKNEINQLTTEQLKEELYNYKIGQENKNISTMIDRIKKFRLKQRD